MPREIFILLVSHWHLHCTCLYYSRNLLSRSVLAKYAKKICSENALHDRIQSIEESSSKRRSEAVSQKFRIEELEEELAACKVKVIDAEAGLKQAVAQQAEYNRLVDKYNELEQKLNLESPKKK